MKKISFIYAYTVMIYSHPPFRKCNVFNIRTSKVLDTDEMKQQIMEYLTKKHNITDIITMNVSNPNVINVNDCRFPIYMLHSVIVI